jgi:hypothetical protein
MTWQSISPVALAYALLRGALRRTRKASTPFSCSALAWRTDRQLSKGCSGPVLLTWYSSGSCRRSNAACTLLARASGCTCASRSNGPLSDAGGCGRMVRLLESVSARLGALLIAAAPSHLEADVDAVVWVVRQYEAVEGQQVRIVIRAVVQVHLLSRLPEQISGGVQAERDMND